MDSRKAVQYLEKLSRIILLLFYVCLAYIFSQTMSLNIVPEYKNIIIMIIIE